MSYLDVIRKDGAPATTPADRIRQAIRSIAQVFDHHLLAAAPEQYLRRAHELGKLPVMTIAEIAAWEAGWLRLIGEIKRHSNSKMASYPGSLNDQ